MDVTELNRDQLTELKGHCIFEQNEANGEGTSWDELACADELVSDKEIFEAYDGYSFSEEDFDCPTGTED